MHSHAGCAHIVIRYARTHSPDPVDFRKIRLAGAHSDAFFVRHNFHPRVHIYRADLGMLTAAHKKTHVLGCGFHAGSRHGVNIRHLDTMRIVTVLE